MVAMPTVRGAVMFPVPRRVYLMVPIISDKQNALPASSIVVAITFPMLDMPGRNSQINRIASAVTRLHDDGLRGNHLRRRIVANIQTPVKARLSDIDRDASAGC
ncbi:hypothetical protein BI344_19065 [Chromobacterium sphagni]|uniref:Uncharacterized protein n=1 Tax=Chromobacterium sphagni TaxID=1903179 RepID=A0ABX3CAD7_9NEIS|nr:hypothetical protein BI344_19065 [Chromobacterium sphagni]